MLCRQRLANNAGTSSFPSYRTSLYFTPAMPLPDSGNCRFNFQPPQARISSCLSQPLRRLAFFLLFPFLTYMPASSQTYTPQEANTITHKLRALKILSPKGEQILLSRIRHTGTGYRQYADTESDPTVFTTGLSKSNGFGPGYEEISNHTLLLFLEEAFGREFYYRTAPAEITRVVMNAEGKATADARVPRQTARSKAYAQGPRLEAAIPTEDSFSQSWGFTSYGPPASTEEDTYGWIDTARSAVGKTRSRTVRDLQTAGLIEPVVAAEILPAIENNTLKLERTVLEKAASLQGFRDDYAISKTQELQTAQRLVATGAMTAANKKELTASYQPYQLKEKRGLLPFCERTLIFRTADLPADLAPFFDTVFAQVRAQLLPGFKYQNLVTTVYRDSTEMHSVKRNYTLQFEVDGKGFKYQNLYDYDGLKHHFSSELPINAGITKAVNKWLAQQGAPQRLFFANYPDSVNFREGRQQFALLLLTQAQFKAWQTDSDDNFIAEEVYNPAFTSQSIGNQIGLWSIWGLFNHLSDSEKYAGFTKARTAVINSYTELLACFPRTVVVLDAKTPYDSLTKELAAVSRGAFKPANIKSDFGETEDGSVETAFSFDFGGRHYATRLKKAGSEPDGAFMELLQKALKENKAEGRWYYCSGSGQERACIFLTPKQHAALKEEQPALFSED